MKDKNESEIVVGDISYKKNRIINALEHTGILNIENWIESEMKNIKAYRVGGNDNDKGLFKVQSIHGGIRNND